MQKEIKGFEGLYEVTTEGEIITLGNFPKLRNKVIGILKPGIIKGYASVVLTDSLGKRKSKLVHRLVAETFIDNPLNLRCVNHKDENKLNNKVENLEWCSDQYNKEYSNKKTFYLKSPEGVVYATNNLCRFCRENNLLQGNICKVLTKERNHHRGWSLP